VPFGSLRRRQRHLTTLHDEEPIKDPAVLQGTITRRATATSEVRGAQDRPKIGVLMPVIRLAISETRMSLRQPRQ
jgi:hypothetical protein